MHEASFWEKAGDSQVHCLLCRFGCRIGDGRRGLCGVRENRGGTLYTLVYGRAIAENADPIEKKPLFHFYPGSRSFSIATVGCNLHCLHCQNYEISQLPAHQKTIPGSELPPADIVRQALEAGCRSIAYTYTEPTIFYEYAYDTAVLAKQAGLANVFVTNGYITSQALARIAPWLDAANVDLKFFSPQTYKSVTGADLAGVLATLKEYRRHCIWLEVTTLVIPGLNDGDAELTALARFIHDELGPQVPWHVSAFYPTYKMLDHPPTPAATLRRARQIGIDVGLRYVYEGNVPGEAGEHTFCPGCGRTIVERNGFRLGRVELVGGRCRFCGELIAGVGLDQIGQAAG